MNLRGTFARLGNLVFVVLLAICILTVAAVAPAAAPKKSLKISPSSGPGGTEVTITGLKFPSPKGSVTFGTQVGVDVTWTETEIKVKAPSVGPTKNLLWNVVVKDQSGAVIGVASFTETPAPPTSAINTTETDWGDADQDPVGLTLLGGWEQGYQSANQADSYGFLDLYGRKLFGADRIGPFFGIRLQTAPQASNANGIVSVLTNPSGVITTQSLKGVGSAVDLNVGLDLRLINPSKRTSLDFIAGGGFITPALANTVSAVFKTPAFGSQECIALQSRLTEVGTGPYSNISFGKSTNCLVNTIAGKQIPIAQLVYATPDRNSFYGKAFGGLRIVNRWPTKEAKDGTSQKTCDPDNPCERGLVDFTFGQNASITAGKMRHFVFTIDSVYPMPIAKISYLYLFGSISKRILDSTVTQGPLILQPGVALTGAPTTSDLTLPLTQADRDFYRIGAGINAIQIFKALSTKKE